MPKPAIKLTPKKLLNKFIRLASDKWNNDFTLTICAWTDGSYHTIARHGHQGNGFMKKTGEELSYKNGKLTYTKFKVKRTERVEDLECKKLKF